MPLGVEGSFQVTMRLDALMGIIVNVSILPGTVWGRNLIC